MQIPTDLFFSMFSSNVKQFSLDSVTFSTPMLFKDIVSRTPNLEKLDIIHMCNVEFDNDWPYLLIKYCNKLERVTSSFPLGNIESEKEKLRKISFTIKDLKKERVNMNYNVTLKSVPKYNVISVRDTIPSYDAEGMLWQRLGGFIMKNTTPCGDVAYATHQDEGYKEGPVDVEVIMNVKELFTNEEGFEFKETEPLEQAASIFVPGDYSNLTPAYIYLAKWIEENNYSICGNARQLCIKGPWNEQNPNDYLSEIQIPIKNID